MLGISKLQIVLVTLLAWSACNAFGQQTQTAGNQEVVSFLAPGRASQAGALQQLSGQDQPAVGRARQATSPEERGQPSWGSYLTPTDDEGTSDGPTRVRFLLLMCRLCLLCRLCIYTAAGYFTFAGLALAGDLQCIPCNVVLQSMIRLILTHICTLQGTVILTLSAPERLSFNVTLNKPFSASDPLQSILISKPSFINSTAATLATLVGGNASNTQVVSHPHACMPMHHCISMERYIASI